MYDFDTVYLQPPRTTLGSEKWLLAQESGSPPDVVPFTIADMEFATAPEIIEEVKRAAALGLWGYTGADDTYFEAVTGWMKTRHNWAVKPESIVLTSGVVHALNTAVRAFTQPGDKIIIQPPVYHPFFYCIQNNNRVLSENPLKLEKGRYVMDFDDLEAKAAGAKMMILCSPHNPVGRVWTRPELEQVAQICHKHNVLLFCDEIHHDLLMQGAQHTTFGLLNEIYQHNTIIGTAASKTFSLAGLSCSNIMIENEALREQFEKQLASDGVSFNSFFGMVATRAAYRYGSPWLKELLAYIHQNYQYLKEIIQNKIPELTLYPMEGTYLAWIDFSGLCLNKEQLETLLRKKANLFMNSGEMFGTGGAGFYRINLACPRSVLEASIQRLIDCVKSY